ncbi:TetR/AcrR family transcriptional regulator [Brevibacillus sp. DP1.3A]|uniref:TetR/AcrR family transcriptional regulator n=1 Tax=Brevibacillus sp. DP1.3A TaxID=2738867 RepID=UPI00156AEB3A|nr:TetR/AcrR family transcriptional regulator [Brevibacillus sp. DP1.3A]UED74703.1 TetR/AcrR family transcriptional regulator [Brevibacillus sp. DP1.3A]
MSQVDKNSETKAKILQSTLDLIKMEGFETVTVRKIAADSGTNVALVNYYFGSKDKLINEALSAFLGSFTATFDLLDNTSLLPQERLKQFLMSYVQIIQQYPELVSRIFSLGGAVFTSQYEYGQFLKSIGFVKIEGVLKEMTHEEDHEVLMMMIMQLFGAIFLPALLKSILSTGAGIEVASVEQQIDLLFARYFHEK